MDYIQSLVRSEDYRRDYEALTRCKHDAEPWLGYEPKPGHESKEDNFRKYLEAERSNPLYRDPPGQLSDEEEEKYFRYRQTENNFRMKWPDLRLPIPPDEAKKTPEKYLQHLCDPVEVIPPRSPLWPGGKIALGELIVVGPDPGSDEKRERKIRAADLWEGRYLYVRIDLSRSKPIS